MEIKAINNDQQPIPAILPETAFLNATTTFESIWGLELPAKTESAFDKINTRRLVLALQEEITKFFTYCLTTQFGDLVNDVMTRSSFCKHVNEYLNNIVQRRLINNFRVVCDRTNNDEYSRNEFRADIYIQPTKAIEFIQLNFIAVPSQVSFDEVVGKF